MNDFGHDPRRRFPRRTALRHREGRGILALRLRPGTHGRGRLPSARCWVHVLARRRRAVPPLHRRGPRLHGRRVLPLGPHRRRLRPCGNRGPCGVREPRRDDCLHARHPCSSRSPGRVQAARPLVPICAAFPQFSQKKAARHALSLSWNPTHTRIAARERTTSI